MWSRPRALALLVAACLLGASGCSEERALPPGTVEVTFWHSMSGPLGKALKKLIDSFHKKHPKIRVRPVFQGGYAQLSQKINLALMDGSPPDMAQMYEAMIAFCNRTEESIRPLDDLIAADPELDFDDIYEPFRSTITQDGKVYSLPPTKSFPVLYWNKELFEAAGLERAPETWAELAEYGRTLTRDEDGDGTPEQWGYAFVTDAWVLECMVLQEGGSFLDAEGRSALGGAPARKAIQFLLDAATGPDRYAYRTTGYDHQLDFAQGKVGMIIGSTVSRTFMNDQVDFRMGVAPLPQGTRKVSIMAGPNVAIFKDRSPEHHRASFEFLKFFTSTNATLYWGISTNYLPIRKSAVQSEAYQRRLAADPGFAAGIAQIPYATSEPPLPAWYECRQILNNTIQKSFHDPAELDQLLGEAVEEMNRVLDAAKSRQSETEEEPADSDKQETE